MRHTKIHLLTFLKGMGMGAADIVPGVSGGTIALITGIYETLLDSIKSIDLEALKLLGRFKLSALWKHINGSFLVALFLGIFTSIFTLSKLITYLMEVHPIPLWSFFCGLIIISSVLILRDIKRWNLMVALAIPVGAVLAYWVTGLNPVESPNSLYFTFISGAIAICAMILPGISGSFLLLILGKYEAILMAVTEKDFLTLGVFAVGCLVGLLSFSRLISWLLKNHHAVTIAVLSGFMLGSINKIWPWKKVVSFRISSSGEQKPFITENLLPNHYLAETGSEPKFFIGLLAFLFGILLVIGLERMAFYLKKR
ncbi:DUF368 domain-containing protein [Echinicola strongylocentroti]|uniref:DUF368 domain-containing protein n=1 Tax=Echinicola strongylocentroti TaxID=1795355 RepID=A0A2Z4IK06_9BACT|nr:DUF368 domain-containing protein [Echinicola strongylocentroti]AWW30858.1 DUF368 domain-containing protein [Echinicola strongylocentroti]